MSDLNKIIEDLSKLTVVEAAELSKQLEEKGYSSCTGGSSSSTWSGSSREEKSEFSLFLAAQETKKLMLLKKLEQLLD